MCRVKKELAGGCVCAFGAGVLITGFLPGGVLLFFQGAILVGVGALLLIGR